MNTILFGNNLRMFNADLANVIGINESIMLQQLHYLLNPKFNKNIKDGRHWVYNSYPEWKEKEFSFWSVDTIQRIFASLEKQKLVDSRRLSKNSRDRTKWYSINYENVSKLELVIGTSGQNAMMEPHEGKMPCSITAKCHVPSPQNAMMSKVQENYLQENKQNKTTRAREAASEIEAIEPSKVEPSIDLTADHSFSESVLKENIEQKQPTPTPMPEPTPEEEPLPLAASEIVAYPEKPKAEKSLPLAAQNFLMFWAAYPHKVGKGAAVKAFDRAIKKTSLATILGALEAQELEREHCARLGVWTPPWANPATWLNQDRWENVCRTSEELQREAQVQWKQKMSYRDFTAVQSAVKQNSFIERMKARAETAGVEGWKI